MRPRLITVFALSVCFLGSVAARAADRIWDGGGTSNLWSNPANWDGNAAPPASGDSLTFDGAVGLTNTNDLTADSVFGPITLAPAAGTYVIGGNRITLGGTLTSDSQSEQTLNLPLSLNDNRIVAVNGPSLVLGGIVSGENFGLTKTGTGNLVFRAANTYTGPTVLDGGAVTYAVDNIAGPINFGPLPTGPTAADPNIPATVGTNTSTLDLTNANLTTSGLVVRTNNPIANPNVINIGAGKTLTVNGGFSLGVNEIYTNVPNVGGGVVTALNVTGNTLVVNGGTAGFQVGLARANTGPTGNDPIGNLDMSALSNFTYTGTTGQFTVGAGNNRSTAILANTSNTITAAQLRIGDSSVGGSGNNNGGRGVLRLGAGTNVINTNTLIIGETKAGGTLDFQSGDGTLTIAGQAGGASTANIQVGSSSNATGSGDESMLLLAGHNVTVQGNNVVIGRLAGSASAGNSGRGNVTFDTGTFNANSLQLGVNSAGTAPNGATGTFTLGGPDAGNTTATGVLNVANQFFLANRTNANAGAGPSRGRFIVNGGTANINTDILDASTTIATSGANETTLTLDGGTINMAGHHIGTYAAPITTINLNSGTLNNPGRIAGQIINILPNVTITGAPTYVVAPGGTLTSSLPTLTLASGGGLEGGGASAGLVGGNVTAASGSRIAPGSSNAAGSLQHFGALTLENDSTARFKLSENPTSGNDQIIVNGDLTLAGTVNLDIAALGAGPQVGNTYTLFTYSGALTGNETNLRTTGLKSRSTFTVLPTSTTPGSIQLSVGGTAPVPLTWIGNVNNNWDVDGAANWRDAANAPQKFFTLDPVTFDDTSTNMADIQLVGQLAPGSITVNANRNYKFAGTGTITGGTGLSKSGTGTLVLATDNSYGGTTDINGGTLQVGDGGATGSLGSGAINLNQGTLAFNRTTALNVASPISGNGNVVQNGTGTLTLSGANSFGGGITVNAGAVRLPNAAAASFGPLTVNNTGTLVVAGNVTNLVNLGGGTLGISSGPSTFSADVTAAAGTTSTIRMADPQNLPITGADVPEIVITGNLQGSGNINILSNGQDNNPDGGNGFRLRGTGTSNYSGTITVGNNVKFELQTTTSPFSPAGTGRIVMTAGDATLGNTLTAQTTTGGYSLINLRNNTDADATFGNDMAIAGTGMVVLNPLALGTGQPGFKVIMGNLSIGAGQELVVSLNAAPVRSVEFPSVALNGTATFSPKKPGFAAVAAPGGDLFLGPIGETVANSGINMSGLRTLTLTGNNTYTGATTVNSGTLSVTGSVATSSGVTVNATGTFEAAASQRVKALTVNAGGSGVIPTGPTKVLTVGDNTTATPLQVAGRLDLNANGLAVDYAPGSDAGALASVKSQVAAGYNNGDWLGSGITSSVAAANANHAVGYGLASDVVGPAGGDFLGAAVDATTLVARDTISGDANLDGAVSFPDLVRLAQNYNATGVAWPQGDFTYDGAVNFADLVKLAQNYNSTVTPAAAEAFAPEFRADLAAAFAQVPEPSVTALACLGALSMMRRRRA